MKQMRNISICILICFHYKNINPHSQKKIKTKVIHIIKLTDLRNKVSHEGDKKMDEDEFRKS